MIIFNSQMLIVISSPSLVSFQSFISSLEPLHKNPLTSSSWSGAGGCVSRSLFCYGLPALFRIGISLYNSSAALLSQYTFLTQSILYHLPCSRRPFWPSQPQRYHNFRWFVHLSPFIQLNSLAPFLLFFCDTLSRERLCHQSPTSLRITSTTCQRKLENALLVPSQ